MDTVRTDKRKAPRFQARFDALYSTGPAEGTGVLTDISYAGTRLEHASLRPGIGTKVRLYVFVQPIQPFELTGEVVRHTEDGFAISTDSLAAEVRRLVDDVAALVNAPRNT